MEYCQSVILMSDDQIRSVKIKQPDYHFGPPATFFKWGDATTITFHEWFLPRKFP